MTRTGDFVTGTIIVTAIGETFRTYRNENVPQWSLDVTPPWPSQYPTKLWIDVGRFEKPPIGTPLRVKLKVGKLAKDTYDGNMPWMWRYFVEELPYDGPDLTTSQPSQDARAGAQGATPIKIRWGQAVNLAASSMPPTSDGRQFDQEVGMLLARAKRLFPLLLEWEKAAVDDYLQQVPADPGPTSEPEALEQELQNQEAGSSGDADFDAIPSASTSNPNLPSTGSGHEAWTYEDFKREARKEEPVVTVEEIAGAFDYPVGLTVEAGVKWWVLDTGKSFYDALLRLREQRTYYNWQLTQRA